MREDAGDPLATGLLSRVPSGFETGYNAIFDNVLIRRDLYSAGAFNITVGDRENYRVRLLQPYKHKVTCKFT